MLVWLYNNFLGLQLPPRVFEFAANRGDLESVRFLHENDPAAFSPRAFNEARIGGHCDVLEYLFDHFLPFLNDEVAYNFVYETEPEVGAIVAKYIKQPKCFQDVYTQTSEKAATDGRLHVLQTRYDQGLLLAPVNIDSVRNLDTIKFLHERGLATATTEAMDRAVEAYEDDQWEIVESLHYNRTEGCTTRTLDVAALRGNYEHVKFLLENRSEGCSPRAIDTAALCLDPRIVWYLLDHTTAGCTTDAMDNAASAGHLDVVKFLHENRTEGCTTRAMNKAAGNGHIGVVKFLHENRMEGCIVKAASDALYGGTEMVAFLFKHYRGFFGKDHLHDLLLYGAFETYKELAESYPDKPRQVVESVMLQSSEEGQLPTIRFIINDLGRKDVASIAMDGAASYSNYCSRAQWIRAVSAVTGGQSCTPSAFENTACKANTESPELHPFLSDPRAPMWAIRLVLDDMLQYDTDPYWRGSLTWPIRAAYHGDLTLLEILRDLKEQGYGADDSLFSFDGARAAAIREGNLELLQWMIINIDLPVEPTLLDEAVFYHKYDIAEWIVANHPEACRELVWQGKTYIGWETSSVFDDGLLDWIESTESVRTAINIGGIIDYAVHYNYVDELRRLHSWDVEKFLARPGLMAIARGKNHDAAVQFLEEIGYEQ